MNFKKQFIYLLTLTSITTLSIRDSYAKNTAQTLFQKEELVKAPEHSEIRYYLENSKDFYKVLTNKYEMSLSSCTSEGECSLERSISLENINQLIHTYNKEKKSYPLHIAGTMAVFGGSLYVCMKTASCSKLVSTVGIFGASFVIGTPIAYVSSKVSNKLLPTIKYSKEISEINTQVFDSEVVQHRIVTQDYINRLRVHFSKLELAIEDIRND